MSFHLTAGMPVDKPYALPSLVIPGRASKELFDDKGKIKYGSNMSKPLIPIIAALAILLFGGCDEISSRLEPVDIVLDESSVKLPVGASILVWGSRSVTAVSGSDNAMYAVADSAVADRYHLHTAVTPLDGGLRWLPKTDAAMFYAVCPAVAYPSGSKGTFEGIEIPDRQSADARGGMRGVCFAEPTVGLRDERVRLVMQRAYTLVEVHLDTTALLSGNYLLASVSLTSTMAPLCGKYDIVSSEGAFRCPERDDGNSRVTMSISGAPVDADGRIVLPFVLLPLSYAQLSLEMVLLGNDGQISRYVLPLASPVEGSIIRACSECRFTVSLPSIEN